MIRESFSIEAVEYVDGANDQAAEARARYKSEFPGRTVRRMTHLGMMVGVCLKSIRFEQDVPVIYASAFAESESLELFIDSFPMASPALFQRSIHPSAVEQALIPGHRAVDRFYPITSCINLAGHALEHCFLLGDESVVLVGGEERGGWLCPYHLASDVSFGFALKLGAGSGGVGRVTIDRSMAPGGLDGLEFPAFASAIANRQPVKVPAYGLGASIRVDW